MYHYTLYVTKVTWTTPHRHSNGLSRTQAVTHRSGGSKSLLIEVLMNHELKARQPRLMGLLRPRYRVLQYSIHGQGQRLGAGRPEVE
jgi:hypothetical protein